MFTNSIHCSPSLTKTMSLSKSEVLSTPLSLSTTLETQVSQYTSSSSLTETLSQSKSIATTSSTPFPLSTTSTPLPVSRHLETACLCVHTCPHHVVSQLKDLCLHSSHIVLDQFFSFCENSELSTMTFTANIPA